MSPERLAGTLGPGAVVLLTADRIWPAVGRQVASTCFSGFHRSDLTIARAHWKYTESTRMTMTDLGGLLSTANESSTSASVQRCARPLTRSVVPDPGIRNRSAIRGSR